MSLGLHQNINKLIYQNTPDAICCSISLEDSLKVFLMIYSFPT